MSIIPLLENAIYAPTSRYLNSFGGDAEDFKNSLAREILGQLIGLTLSKTLLDNMETSVSSDKDKFQASFDVQQFKPEEICVKVTGDKTVTIEGKHEEKQDEHGYISRHFIRRYELPENCDIKHVKSKLSSDGVLTIIAPKIGEEKKIEYREIPVIKRANL